MGYAYFDNISIRESASFTKTTYEAENASLESCSVLENTSASDGACVLASSQASSMTFNVLAPETAEYMLEIRYTNGG